MAEAKRLTAMAANWSRVILIGALAIAPLGITLWVLWLLMQLAALVGGVVAKPISGWAADLFPMLAPVLASPLVSGLVDVLAAIVLLTVVGVLAQGVIGRAFGRAAERFISRIPVAKTVYSSVQQLITSFQSPTEAAQKVVLIEFPSPEMKTVGLVTQRFRAADTGEELAAVYVPTTPNPTSGYVEIVPVERLVWLDWTTSEAIQFVVSAGVTAPAKIRFRPGNPPPSGPA